MDLLSRACCRVNRVSSCNFAEATVLPQNTCTVVSIWSTLLHACHLSEQRVTWRSALSHGTQMACTLPTSALPRPPAVRTEYLSRSALLRAGLLLLIAPQASAAGLRSNPPVNMGTSIKLRTGATVPSVGLGVFLARSGKETYNAVLNSLKIGYRHIDTARMYGNEAEVGKAVKSSGLNRDEVFITSKIYDVDWGYQAATQAIKKSLKALDTQYLDLMLLHHPGDRQGRKEAWQALEDAHKQVCNQPGKSHLSLKDSIFLQTHSTVCSISKSVHF